MERAIHLGGTLLSFLTMIILSLGALFLPWLAVLVGGSKLCPGDVVGGFYALAVLDKGLKICGLRIENPEKSALPCGFSAPCWQES